MKLRLINQDMREASMTYQHQACVTAVLPKDLLTSGTYRDTLVALGPIQTCWFFLAVAWSRRVRQAVLDLQQYELLVDWFREAPFIPKASS